MYTIQTNERGETMAEEHDRIARESSATAPAGILDDRAKLIAERDALRTALTAALAARPAQEPVAWQCSGIGDALAVVTYDPEVAARRLADPRWTVTPLYTAPLAQPGREELVEALEQLHRTEHSKLGDMLEKLDNGANWQGGRVNGIGTALALARRLIGGPAHD